MNARFYAPDAAASGDLISLPDDEARHLARVLRLTAGAAVRVFNGRGGEFDAVVEDAARDRARVRILEARSAAPEPRVAVLLVQAVLKGDKMDDVVRDAVMMGVAAIQPIVTERTEIALAALERGRRRERWERVAVSSAKQCGRAVVPVVHDACAYADALRPAGTRLMLVEPGASGGTIPLRDLDSAPPAQASLLVGPEGGWTPAELTRAAADWQLVSLGGRTLRADAMAIAAIAALFARWGEW